MRKRREKSKIKSLRVGYDNYPFEACTARCYPLKQYCYWESFHPKMNESNTLDLNHD